MMRAEQRGYVKLCMAVLALLLGLALWIEAWPSGQNSALVSEIEDEIRRELSLQNVYVGFPRKLGLSVVGTVPSRKDFEILKSIVNRRVQDETSVYWNVSIEEENGTGVE